MSIKLESMQISVVSNGYYVNVSSVDTGNDDYYPSERYVFANLDDMLEAITEILEANELPGATKCHRTLEVDDDSKDIEHNL